MDAQNIERRREIGQIRRGKTRLKLLQGALELIGDEDPENLTIEDFIRSGGVARGTFYNHFRTKEALLNAIAAQVAERFNRKLQILFENENDPATRIAIAVKCFIAVSAQEPGVGWVLARSTPSLLAGWNESMREGMLVDIREGLERRLFDITSVPAAAAMGMGAVREGIRILLLGDAPQGFEQGIVFMLLRSYGLAPSEADRISKLPALFSRLTQE